MVFLGDGEFDGTTLQQTLNEAGWFYACRTAQSTVATWEGETFRLDALGACSKPGTLIELKEVKITRDAYGPVMVLSCWAKGYQEPLYVVSNMDAAEEACRYYQKRFRIETFFSDQKSRGFHIHKSHISDPQRLSRLLIAACLAYIWIIYLGSLCEKDGWQKIIHRKDRCDLSLFQLGLRTLEYFLNEDFSIPVVFHIVGCSSFRTTAKLIRSYGSSAVVGPVPRRALCGRYVGSLTISHCSGPSLMLAYAVDQTPMAADAYDPAHEQFARLIAHLRSPEARQMSHSELEAQLKVRGRDCCVAYSQPTWMSEVPGPSPSPSSMLRDADSHQRAQTRRLMTIFGEVEMTRMGDGGPGGEACVPWMRR